MSNRHVRGRHIAINNSHHNTFSGNHNGARVLTPVKATKAAEEAQGTQEKEAAKKAKLEDQEEVMAAEEEEEEEATTTKKKEQQAVAAKQQPRQEATAKRLTMKQQQEEEESVAAAANKKDEESTTAAGAAAAVMMDEAEATKQQQEKATQLKIKHQQGEATIADATERLRIEDNDDVDADANYSATANEDQRAGDVDIATLDSFPPAERQHLFQEALTLLQNRLDLPSRLRDRTMVRFAQRFIRNVDADANHATVANEGMYAADVDVSTLNVLLPAERDRICQEAMTLLQEKSNLPSPQRDRSIVRFAQQFINDVKDDIHKMITDTRLVEDDQYWYYRDQMHGVPPYYDGLDSARDTEEKVEKAIRLYPESLTRRGGQYNNIPCECLTYMYSSSIDCRVTNTKAVSFVHLFVELAIEFNSFQYDERGGLLVEDDGGDNLIQELLSCYNSSYDEKHQQLVDATFLAVVVRLRGSGYLMQEDIQQYHLVHLLCQQHYFSEQRFRFLIEWDPSSMLQTRDEYNELPLHWATNNIPKFRMVLDAYFWYYPRWKGLHALFSLDNYGDTPFQKACNTLTRAAVMEVVDDILVRYTTNNELLHTNDNGNAMLVAAIDDTISLDGLYFSIRRQPATMLSMLRDREAE